VKHCLRRDQDGPEELDTEAEDHAADSVRHACMSRPLIRSVPKPKEPEPNAPDRKYHLRRVHQGIDVAKDQGLTIIDGGRGAAQMRGLASD
jgi:hypothetical protein